MNVLVAGAGPTGLTLAIELARRGVGVRLIEKASEHFDGSRGDGLQPRTLEVFDDLGVIDEVLDQGIPMPVIRVSIGGQFVGERRMAEPVDPTPDIPYPNAHMLGQSRTEAILRKRLADFGVEVELSTELVGFRQTDDQVIAELSTGETVTADYLVGADGGRSFVRKTLGIAFEGSTDESIRMLLGDVSADGLDHSYGYWFAGPTTRWKGSHSPRCRVATNSSSVLRSTTTSSTRPWRPCRNSSTGTPDRASPSCATSPGPLSGGRTSGWPSGSGSAASSSPATPPTCTRRPEVRA